MKLLPYVVQNAFICYGISGFVGPFIIMLATRNPKYLGPAILGQWVAARLATFFLTGYVVGRRVTRRHVACTAIVGILLLVALFCFDAAGSLVLTVLSHGKLKGFSPNLLGIVFVFLWVVVMLATAMLGSWLGSRRAPHGSEAPIAWKPHP